MCIISGVLCYKLWNCSKQRSELIVFCNSKPATRGSCVNCTSVSCWGFLCPAPGWFPSNSPSSISFIPCSEDRRTLLSNSQKILASAFHLLLVLCCLAFPVPTLWPAMDFTDEWDASPPPAHVRGRVGALSCQCLGLSGFLKNGNNVEAAKGSFLQTSL